MFLVAGLGNPGEEYSATPHNLGFMVVDRLAEMFKEWVAADPRFELMAPAHFGLICFRLNDGRGEPELAALNKALMDRLNATGRMYLTHTALHGRFTLRMVIGQRTTKERHVRAAWDLIREIAAGPLSTPSA